MAVSQDLDGWPRSKCMCVCVRARLEDSQRKAVVQDGSLDIPSGQCGCGISPGTWKAEVGGTQALSLFSPVYTQGKRGSLGRLALRPCPLTPGPGHFLLGCHLYHEVLSSHWARKVERDLRIGGHRGATLLVLIPDSMVTP